MTKIFKEEKTVNIIYYIKIKNKRLYDRFRTGITKKENVRERVIFKGVILMRSNSTKEFMIF